MELDPEIMRQLLQVFSSELSDQLQLITEGLLHLEKGVDSKEHLDTINSIFRAAHNIKGAARSANVISVSEISHHLESLFSVMKNRDTVPDTNMIDLCFESIDCIRDAMKSCKEDTALTFDLDGLIKRLDTYVVEAGGDTSEPLSSGTSGESFSNELIKKEKQANRKDKPDRIKQSDMVHLDMGKIDHVAATSEEIQGARIAQIDHLQELYTLTQQLQDFANMWTRAAPLWHGNKAVPPGELKKLLEKSGKTILDQNSKCLRVFNSLKANTNHMGLLCNSLQNEVRMMRLVPVAYVLRPMARIVRDLAIELGKQVSFDVIGDKIEIDRAVLDSVRDPLIHLFRNALDHGIELPQDRIIGGKQEEGRLTVRVLSEGGEILMYIEDDGAGISAEKIGETALKKGLATQTELDVLDEDEKLDLIFRPGFSSKEIISDVSGRGVGLDVVRANLRKLKGSVHVNTKEGKGTSFILRLPLTLATDHGLIVQVGDHALAIPTTSVDRVMEIDPQEIIDVGTSQVIYVDERTIPICRLGTVLEIKDDEEEFRNSISLVIISKGWDSVALIVDEIVREREIIIKPLRVPLVSVRNVSGGTVAGSGEVIMVLNPADIVDSALNWNHSNRIPTSDTGNEETHVPRVMVVDDTITTRILERNILESSGYEVAVMADGAQAWEALQQEAFDLVVTDIEMPNMNGFELTEHIKQSMEYADIPVIIVTSLAKNSDRARGIEVGADAYLVKSEFETSALLDVVKQLL